MNNRFLVKYAGPLSIITKKEEEWIECESEPSLGSLISKISEKYSNSFENKSLENRFTFLATLNGEFVPSSNLDQVILQDGDIVMIFPPASGG